MTDPLSLYGPEMHFKVYRDGTRVGDHSVRFERNGEDLKVASTFDVAVKLFFITAYEFSYKSSAVWRDGTLYTLEAETNDDGDLHPLMVRRNGDALSIDGYEGELTAAYDVFPTNHWNSDIVRHNPSVVLNTLTGGLNDIELVKRDRELVETGTGMRMATRYDYTGGLENSVWYDDDGRWVRMRFEAEDGSIIEHVCTLCGPADAVISSRAEDAVEASNSQ